MEPRKVTKIVKTKRGKKRVVVTVKPQIGSAAADWSRWPAGTVFRLISTGQVYKIDDYGWALAGRNTIDLYMPTPNEMNKWGARSEPIQILRWGDPDESLRLLPGTRVTDTSAGWSWSLKESIAQRRRWISSRYTRPAKNQERLALTLLLLSGYFVRIGGAEKILTPARDISFRNQIIEADQFFLLALLPSNF